MSSINLAYAGDLGQGPTYPWIQANIYQPRSLNEEINLVIPDDAFNMLRSGDQERLGAAATEISFGTESSLAFTFGPDVRWVILDYPRTFRLNKATKDVSYIQRGEKFGTTYKAVSRVLLACLAKGDLVLDEDGNPQIFLLKLTGLKTNWINGKGKERTIRSLNEGLCKHWKAGSRKWLGHLVSVDLCVKPKLFEGANDSSMGVMFGFSDSGAKPLTDAQQKLCFELRNTSEFQDFSKNPFGIGAERSSQSNRGDDDGTPPADYYQDPGTENPDYDSIPF